MNSLKREDILRIYNKLVIKACQKYKSNEFEESLDWIVTASTWMYYFNIIYSDIKLEEVIHHISEKVISESVINDKEKDRIVFIDNFGFDNRGLTQQYLRAFMNLDKEILYILHNESPVRDSEIINELREYKRAKFIIYNTNRKDLCAVASKISVDIADFRPNDIFIHIAPWDVVTLLSLASISGPVKYNINLTDHAYWLGTSFFDYNIEFRGYGELLSLQKRNIEKQRQIKLPFYPIISKFSKFQGFPKIPSDSIVVFCGGAEYKMLGKDGIFFKLMDIVLDISDNVHIIVAGIPEKSVFSGYVSNMRHGNRVHLIGNRSDINEVFNHSDIFLSSYPFIGGLMTQYAAYNRLPILAYAEPYEANLADPFVNHLHTAVCSRRSLEDFRKYATRIIKDKDFRKEEGEKNYYAMMNQGFFESYLLNLLKTHTTDAVFQHEQPDYDYMVNFYIENENQTHNALFYLVSRLRLKSFLIAPLYWREILKIFFNIIKDKIKK